MVAETEGGELMVARQAEEVGSLRRSEKDDGMVAKRGKLVTCEVEWGMLMVAEAERGKLMEWWQSSGALMVAEGEQRKMMGWWTSAVR